MHPGRRTTRLTALAALAVTIIACSETTEPDAAVRSPATTTTTTASSSEIDLCPFSGVGTWVDVYDYVDAFAERGRVSPVKPDAVGSMRKYGVQALYLQVAKDDPRSPGLVTDEARAGAFLEEAHAAGIAVVAWYLPTHRDPSLDLERMRALIEFESGGERFDGIALDIEGTEAVTDVNERNRLLLDLVARVDEAAGAMPVGAIVYPPIAFDVLNPTLWPDFPWREIAPHVDVWLPMAYWTFRDSGTQYRDAYLYSVENVQRLRAHLGEPEAPVHVIGGIGDETTTADLDGLRLAADDVDAIGYSVYDFDTLAPSAWPILTTTPVACEACCSGADG